MTAPILRLVLSIIAIVIWAAITLVVPTLLLDSEISPQDLVTKNLA